MNLLNEALKKFDQKINPDKQKRYPVKIFLIAAGIFVLGFFIARAIFSSSFMNSAIRPGPTSPAQPSRTAVPAVVTAPAVKLPKPALFAPRQTPPAAPFVLGGIFYSDNEGYAIINNQVVRLGETINGARLVYVTEDGAELDLNGEIIELRVGKK